MDSPIFVVGCDRSGTSLLALMLDQSPDLKMIFESGFLPRLKVRSDDYGDFTDQRQRWYFLRDLQRLKATSKTFAFDKFENLSDCEAEAALREAAPTDYRGAASAIFSAAAGKEGKKRWGEKMPRYVQKIDWLASAFPDCQIVHIIRDPRDVAASICRAGWEPSLRSAAETWKERVSTGRKQGLSMDSGRYHEVRFEVLLQNPKQVLRQLLDQLDIKFDTKVHSPGARIEGLPESHRKAYPDLFENLGRPIDSSRAYAWRREMTRQEVADVESVAAPVMNELNYKRSGAKVPILIRGLRWFMDKAVPIARKVKNKYAPQL